MSHVFLHEGLMGGDEQADTYNALTAQRTHPFHVRTLRERKERKMEVIRQSYFTLHVNIMSASDPPEGGLEVTLPGTKDWFNFK